MPDRIPHQGRDPLDVITKQTQCSVARAAEKSPDAAAVMVVVNM